MIPVIMVIFWRNDLVEYCTKSGEGERGEGGIYTSIASGWWEVKKKDEMSPTAEDFGHESVAGPARFVSLFTPSAPLYRCAISLRLALLHNAAFVCLVLLSLPFDTSHLVSSTILTPTLRYYNTKQRRPLPSRRLPYSNIVSCVANIIIAKSDTRNTTIHLLMDHK